MRTYSRRRKLFFDDKYNIQNHVTERGSDPAQSSGPSTTRKSVFSSIYKQRRADNEVDKYLSLPIEEEDTDVIVWWKNQESYLPCLQKMAFVILGIPATSVPSEQSFSKAGNLITKTEPIESQKYTIFYVPVILAGSSWN